jgi:ferredoxin
MAIEVDRSKCIKCGGCVGVCPADALLFTDKINLDNGKCISCRNCVKFCPVGALRLVE